MAEKRSRKRDKLLSVFSPSRSRSTSANNNDTRIQAAAGAENKIDHSSPGANASPIQVASSTNLTIYEEAFSKLSKEDQKIVGDHAGLEDSIEAAELLRSTCSRATIKWQFRGKTVYLRDLTDSIVEILDMAKPVGDFVADLEPTYAGLPWAGIKALLELSVMNRKQRTTLLQGIERALHSSRRTHVYASFLSKTPSSQAADNMRESLVEMYKKILEFLAIAIRTYTRNAVVRTVQPLWLLSTIEDFDSECEEMMVIIDRDASSCDRERWEVSLANLQSSQSTAAIRDLSTQIQLTNLATASSAIHDSRNEAPLPRCLEGTRKELLEDLERWADSEEHVFWLCGQAGTGKSTISRTLADRIQASGDVVASFFFKKTEAQRRDASLFFSTIVQQLADQIEPLRSHVAEALKKTSSLADKGLFCQYQELLETPLKACAMPSIKIYIIIDALDECQVIKDVKGILKIILDVNINLRVFVTSRPEFSIVNEFANGARHQEFRLEHVEPTVAEHDIRLFVADQLSKYTKPGDGKLEVLTKMTTPLFVAASTLCNYILEYDSENTIDSFLKKEESLTSTSMSEFYFTILDEVVQSLSSSKRREQYVAEYQIIVGSLAVLADPIPAKELALLLGMPQSKVDAVLEKLHSVFSTSAAIRPLHLSFYESLCQPNSSSLSQEHSRFIIDETERHQDIFKACINILNHSLKQDLIDAKLPGTHREMIQQSQLDQISPTTRYAGLYWTYHLEHSDHVDQQILLVFLSTHLLHWFELMSWLVQLPAALKSLTDLADRVHHVDNVDEHLEQLIQDARRLLQQNLYIIDRAPLQIYLSILLHAPESSTITHYYQQVLNDNIFFEQLPSNPTSWHSNRWTVPCGAIAICISHNQHNIATMGYDNRLRLYSTDTGTLKLQSSRIETGSPSAERWWMTFAMDDLSVTSIETIVAGQRAHMKVKWDLHSGQVSEVRHPFAGKLLACSATLTYALFHERNGVFVGLLDMEARTHLMDVENYRRCTASVSPTGRFSAIAYPNATTRDRGQMFRLDIYSNQSAQLIATLNTASVYKLPLLATCFLEKTYLAISSPTPRRTIQILDLDSLEQVASDDAAALTMSADQRLLNCVAASVESHDFGTDALVDMSFLVRKAEKTISLATLTLHALSIWNVSTTPNKPEMVHDLTRRPIVDEYSKLIPLDIDRCILLRGQFYKDREMVYLEKSIDDVANGNSIFERSDVHVEGIRQDEGTDGRQILSLKSSASSKTFALGMCDTISLYNDDLVLTSELRLGELRLEGFEMLIFSPDGQYLSCFGYDQSKRKYVVSIWNLQDPEPIFSMPCYGDCRRTFSLNGTCVAFAVSKDRIVVVDLNSRKVVLEREGTWPFEFSTDGKDIAICAKRPNVTGFLHQLCVDNDRQPESSTLEIWNIHTGILIASVLVPYVLTQIVMVSEEHSQKLSDPWTVTLEVETYKVQALEARSLGRTKKGIIYGAGWIMFNEHPLLWLPFADRTFNTKHATMRRKLVVGSSDRDCKSFLLSDKLEDMEMLKMYEGGI